MRFRQFQLDRDPDGGDRRACPQSAADDRAARHPRADRRIAGEPDVGGARRADHLDNGNYADQLNAEGAHPQML